MCGNERVHDALLPERARRRRIIMQSGGWCCVVVIWKPREHCATNRKYPIKSHMVCMYKLTNYESPTYYCLSLAPQWMGGLYISLFHTRFVRSVQYICNTRKAPAADKNPTYKRYAHICLIVCIFFNRLTQIEFNRTRVACTLTHSNTYIVACPCVNILRAGITFIRIPVNFFVGTAFCFL